MFKYKKLFIFIIFTVSSFFLHGQTLSIDDLIKIDNASVENIETFLISKKFVFAGVEEDALSKSYTYSYNRSNTDYKKAKAFVTKYYYHNGESSGKSSVSYQILDSEYYGTFKNSLAAKGYKFVSKENKGDVLGQHYESSKYKIDIWQGVKDGMNWYEISLEAK